MENSPTPILSHSVSMGLYKINWLAYLLMSGQAFERFNLNLQATSCKSANVESTWVDTSGRCRWSGPNRKAYSTYHLGKHAAPTEINHLQIAPIQKNKRCDSNVRACRCWSVTSQLPVWALTLWTKQQRGTSSRKASPRVYSENTSADHTAEV